MKADDVKVKGPDLWGIEGRDYEGKSAENCRGGAKMSVVSMEAQRDDELCPEEWKGTACDSFFPPSLPIQPWV